MTYLKQFFPIIARSHNNSEIFALFNDLGTYPEPRGILLLWRGFDGARHSRQFGSLSCALYRISACVAPYLGVATWTGRRPGAYQSEELGFFGGGRKQLLVN